MYLYPLIISVLVLAIAFQFYINLRFRKKVKNLLKKKSKKGYYIVNYNYVPDKSKLIEAIVYIEEILKYKNGLSKIKYLNHEIQKCPEDVREALNERIKRDFVSLKKTSDIDWLEVEMDLSEERKEKLRKIGLLEK